MLCYVVWELKFDEFHTSFPLNCGILSSRPAKICTVYRCWTMAEVRLSEQLEAENEDTGSSETLAAETGKQFSVPLTPSPIDLEASN
jgi:hypothetical protein